MKKLAEKLAAEKIVAAQGKAAAAPPATGRGGIQIPKPNAKIVLMMNKSDSSGAEGEDYSSSSEPEDQMQWLFRVSAWWEAGTVGRRCEVGKVHSDKNSGWCKVLREWIRCDWRQDRLEQVEGT